MAIILFIFVVCVLYVLHDMGTESPGWWGGSDDD